MSELDPHPTPSFARADRGRIQGIVTSGYGHLTHTAYVFLRLARKAGKAGRAWLTDLLQRDAITSARTWRQNPKRPKIKPARTLNLAFTYAGLRKWGVDEETLASFPREFASGAAEEVSARALGDVGESAPNEWEFGASKGGEIHLAVILHATTEDERDLALRELNDSLSRHARGSLARVGDVQLGRHLIHLDPGSGERTVKEHFGFRDGISQPELRGLKKDSESRRSEGGNVVAAGEFVLGYPDEYGFYPPTPLTRRERDAHRSLPESPYRARFPDHVDFGYNGSYLVYRKLSQDVAAFWNDLRGEAERLFGRVEPGAMVWLAAKLVGRWPNGVPLVEAPDLVDMTRHAGPLNEFLFAKADPDGSKCPFGAHVRRANPRDLIQPGSPDQSQRMSARHRILRRGSSYGESLFNLSVLDNPGDGAAMETLRRIRDDGRERGLHFLCLNADIRRQFEFVQQSWCASRTFNALRREPDPLVGGFGERADDAFEVPGHPNSLRLTSLSRYVRTRAAAYLFVPGFDTLRYLSRLKD